jgi:TM2 domain-containing membrane protein YozV
MEHRNWLVALLLCIFLGLIGAHRFYTGSIAIGVIQLLTLGGCGIWNLIDLILILVGSYKDANGNPLVKS